MARDVHQIFKVARDYEKLEHARRTSRKSPSSGTKHLYIPPATRCNNCRKAMYYNVQHPIIRNITC